MTFLMPKRSCLENNSLVKAALTGARSVYSVFGPMAAAKPNSDTMSLKVLWEAPISSIPPLADMNRINMTCWGSQKNNIAKSFEQRVFAKVKVELKFKIYIFFFTRVRDENLVDEVDDAIGGDNVLFQHHLNAIDCQAVTITADLYGGALCGLIQ